MSEFTKKSRQLIYSVLPIQLKNLRFRMRGGMGGKAAVAYMRELNESEYASSDELHAIQRTKLHSLLTECYENVPYYRRVMDGLGALPQDIKDVEDLQKFPVLTKEVIRANFDELLNKKFDKSSLTTISTGGTTGAPLQFLFSNHENAVRCAHWERWKKFAGVKQFERFMYIGTDNNAANAGDEYEGTFTPGGYYLMASFGLDDARFEKYLSNIQKYKPNYLRGFAFGCYLLAEFFVRKGIQYPLKAVLTSGDMLYDHFRDVIEKAFCCKVYDHYGQNEDIITATECEQHSGYHINMESCIAEVVNENNMPVQAGETGAILGTNLENYCMPLIRYDITDLGSMVEGDCPCGRKHIRLGSIQGRCDDWIVTPDGKKVGHQLSVVVKYFYNKVAETQFVQEQRDSLVVKYVPVPGYNDPIDDVIIKKMREHLGEEIKITCERVNAIPKTQRGKHRMIVSRIGAQEASERR